MIQYSNFNRRFINSIFLLLFWGFLPKYFGAENPNSPSKHCLWSLKSKSNIIYFMGSIHVLTKKSYPLPDAFENAYKNSGSLVFETDLNIVNDSDFLLKMVTSGTYPDGQTLKENISEKTYNLLQEQIKKLGLTANIFDRLKPWSCALMLTSLELNRLGFDQKFGIDLYFFNKAKKDNKKINGLESNDYHLKLLDELMGNDEEDFMLDTLTDLDQTEKNANDLVGFWEKGDVKELDSFLNSGFEDFPKLHQRLVIQRNYNWIPKIEELMKQKENVLVIVGTGHLVGKESVVEILTNKGYAIKQL